MPVTRPLELVRSRLAQGITRVTSDAQRKIDYSAPLGDAGLYGPDTVIWRVHADFTSMLVGGVAALLLQMLHPLALAGVWDHSTFRTDIHGRLGRTASFIAATTFGARADALALIDRVKRIHLNVTGTTPDGVPYAASDPDLLTWVHVAEMSSFLNAHLRYVNPTMSLEDQDRYYDETALVSEMLGARNVPRTRAGIDAYLEAMRTQLSVDDRTREVLKIVMKAPAPHWISWPVAQLFLQAGPDLLPDWAQAMFGLERSAAIRRSVVRPGVRTVAPIVRWALTNGISKRARARVAGGVISKA